MWFLTRFIAVETTYETDRENIMDLVGMSVVADAEKRKLTLLTAKTPWTPAEVGQLVNGLRNEVIGHPKHPNYLVVRGEYPKELIAQILVRTDYEYTVITGYQNPEVPFAVPL